MLPSPQQLLLPRHAAAAAMPAPTMMRASCSSCRAAAAIPRPRLLVERRQQHGPPRGRAMPPPSPSTLSAVFASQASSPSPSSSSPQTSKAALLVAQGRAKYAAGDRMGALALFESALKQVRPRHRKSVVFVISPLAPPPSKTLDLSHPTLSHFPLHSPTTTHSLPPPPRPRPPPGTPPSSTAPSATSSSRRSPCERPWRRGSTSTPRCAPRGGA